MLWVSEIIKRMKRDPNIPLAERFLSGMFTPPPRGVWSAKTTSAQGLTHISPISEAYIVSLRRDGYGHRQVTLKGHQWESIKEMFLHFREKV